VNPLPRDKLACTDIVRILFLLFFFVFVFLVLLTLIRYLLSLISSAIQVRLKVSQSAGMIYEKLE